MPEPNLLITKFTIPPVRSTLLARSHLLTVLDQSCASPLTLLSASAGFGKTTLLSTWARQSSSQVAWLSLDEQDNDPTRFWAYVIAALRKAGAPVGEATRATLYASQPSPLNSALTPLINELTLLAQETALILDDYHVISEPTLHASMQFLLEHLPACLHLLLASRGDPPLALSRLRARGQVVEVRATDLRLNGAETASFLTRVMGLLLSQEDIGRLETRTEGWIAGLQLAALSLRRHQDRPAFIQAFTGSHRLILDYVQEEILESLPEDQQRFLLQTSVLDRMNADICQALTGEQASQAILESLERANLFLVPLDEERRWYRFHTLFREVLLARLQAILPERVGPLHREAALWYQHQGWLHEAIPHALATGDFFFVASLLENGVERLYLQGEIKMLLAWIKQLPEEVLYAHPRLTTSYLLVFNLLSPFSDQHQEEKEYLHQLRAGVERTVLDASLLPLTLAERDQLRHRLTILDGWELAARALSDGNGKQLSRLAEQMQQTELTDDTMWQQCKLAPFSMAWRMEGNFPPMVATLQESWQKTQMAQQRFQEIQILWGLIAALIALGKLGQAHKRSLELQQLVERLGGPLPVGAYPDVFQAQLAYTWNQLEVAKKAASIAIEKTAPLQYMDILMVAYEVLSRVHLAQGNLSAAKQAIHEMEQVNQHAGIPLFRPWVEALRAHLWLAQGDLTRAADWAEHTTYQQSTLFYSREISYLALVHVYLALQQYPLALQWLAALLSSAEQVERVGSMVSILALQVATLQASGDGAEALRALLRLLTLAEPEGYQRIFLDAGEPMRQALQAFLQVPSQHTASPALRAYAENIHNAFANQPGLQKSELPALPIARVLTRLPAQSGLPLPEPLTPREQEVLYLLAEGTSNQEIARQLVVSLATAKKHVASILSKLGAENRTQAIAYARLRSLL